MIVRTPVAKKSRINRQRRTFYNLFANDNYALSLTTDALWSLPQIVYRT